jgi:hypothetical protein
MNRTELLRLARTGAEARLRDIEAEMDAIVRQFPDLRRGARANGGADGAGARLPRRKRKMSAAGRKRIGEAAKRRWAEWRAKQAAAGEENGAERVTAGGRSRKRK